MSQGVKKLSDNETNGRVTVCEELKLEDVTWVTVECALTVHLEDYGADC
jgi:hypothetical protein